MDMKNWKKEILTIPNLLSLFRILLIPVYMLIYLNAATMEHYAVAAAILAVSCLTDMIDGKIARKFNMISTLGKILDPLADKATQFTLIICLSVKHPVLWALIALFIIKEGFQLIAGIVTLRHGKMLKGALMAGKVCTTILFVSLILLVLIPDLSETTVLIVTLIDCVFMLVSFLEYVRTYSRQTSQIQDLGA